MLNLFKSSLIYCVLPFPRDLLVLQSLKFRAIHTKARKAIDFIRKTSHVEPRRAVYRMTFRLRNSERMEDESLAN